jgi:hypothetical protein
MMLLEALSRREGFEKLNIILLGAGAKLDRSWCFWEQELPQPYQGMVKQTWNKMAVLSSPRTKTESLSKRPYHYIPGDAFFAYFTERFLPAHQNVHHLVAQVIGIEGHQGQFTVHTQQGNYNAAQVYLHLGKGISPYWLWQKTMSFTLLALLILLITVWVWWQYYQHLDPLPVLFIFIAIITLPHLLVMSKMFRFSAEPKAKV